MSGQTMDWFRSIACSEADAEGLWRRTYGRGPLDAARRNAAKFNVTDRMDFAQQDGLGDSRPGPDDVVVIAGMGGIEIIRILQDRQVRCKELVLQPQRSTPELRTFLSTNGYRIRDERLIKDRGKFYIIMHVVYTGETLVLTPSERYLGVPLLHAAKTAFSGVPDADLLKGYLIHLKHHVGKERKRLPELDEIDQLLTVLTE
jgi:tRNA A22 N-methylase